MEKELQRVARHITDNLGQSEDRREAREARDSKDSRTSKKDKSQTTTPFSAWAG